MSTKEIKLGVARTGYQNGQKNRGIIWCIAFVAVLLFAPQVMARPSYLSFTPGRTGVRWGQAGFATG